MFKDVRQTKHAGLRINDFPFEWVLEKNRKVFICCINIQMALEHSKSGTNRCELPQCSYSLISQNVRNFPYFSRSMFSFSIEVWFFPYLSKISVQQKKILLSQNCDQADTHMLNLFFGSICHPFATIVVKHFCYLVVLQHFYESHDIFDIVPQFPTCLCSRFAL